MNRVLSEKIKINKPIVILVYDTSNSISVQNRGRTGFMGRGRREKTFTKGERRWSHHRRKGLIMTDPVCDRYVASKGRGGERVKSD